VGRTLHVGPVVPKLGVAHISVYPRQGQEYRRLQPSEHRFVIAFVGVLRLPGPEKASGIVSPPRQSGDREVESGGDLRLQRSEIVAYVARPHGRVVPLNAREPASGEYHGAAVGPDVPTAFIYGFAHQEGVHVPELLARPPALPNHPVGEVVVLGLGGILPPSVDAIGFQQFLAEMTPVGLCRRGVEEVYPVGPGNVIALLLHLFAHNTVLVYLRPNGQHESHILSMQTVYKQFRVGIMGLVKEHGVPTVGSPVLPVLHDEVYRISLLPEAGGRAQYFVRRMEPFPTMDVAQCPQRHHRRRPGEPTVCGDDLIGFSGEQGEIHTFGNR